jgi:hypothetical protein
LGRSSLSASVTQISIHSIRSRMGSSATRNEQSEQTAIRTQMDFMVAFTQCEKIFSRTRQVLFAETSIYLGATSGQGRHLTPGAFKSSNSSPETSTTQTPRTSRRR